MKKSPIWLLLVLLSVLVFYLSVTPYYSMLSLSSSPPIEYKTRESLFSVVPTKADILMSQEAFEVYQTYIAQNPQSSAMAQSDSGAWGYITREADPILATQKALDYCRSYNRDEKTAPCDIVFLHGEWFASGNSALNILNNIPNWTPNGPILLGAIMSDARSDMTAGYMDAALAKTLWLYQHAAFTGQDYTPTDIIKNIRLWAELAYIYPPAKVLMHHAALHLKETTLRASDFARHHVQESIEMNAMLYYNARTVELFRTIRKEEPRLALMYFGLFDDVLLTEKQFSILNDFIKPQNDYAGLVSTHKRLVDRDAQTESSTNTQYTYVKVKIAQLVSILANNDRQDEALKIVEQARDDFDDAYFNRVLEQALNKTVFYGSTYNTLESS